MKLALGSAQFGMPYGISNSEGQVPPSLVEDILSGAFKYGISTIDTAASYGSSQSVLGKIGIDRWEVITKIACSDVFGPDAIKDFIINSFSDSLKKLRLDKIYGLLLHNPNDLLSPYGASCWTALEEIKEKGLVKKIGVSVYEPTEVTQVMHNYLIDIIQIPLNIIDRRFMVDGCLERLSDAGIEIHARSIFLQGLLLMKAEDRPRYFEKWSDVLGKFDSWIADNNISRVQGALLFVRDLSLIKKIVVGVLNIKQLEELVAAMTDDSAIPLPEIGVSDQNLVNPSKWY